MKTTEQQTGGLRRQLSHAIGWNIVFTPIKFLIDTLATIIKIRLLPPADVGTLSLLSSAASSVGIWIDLGIDQTLPKFIPEVEHSSGHGAVRAFLRRIILFKMLVLGLALLALPWWGGWLLADMQAEAQQLARREGMDKIAPLLEQLSRYGWVFLSSVGALLLLGALYDTLRAYLVSFFRQKAWNVINAIAALLLPLLTAGAVIAGLGVLGVVLMMVLTALISVLITWRHVRRAMHQQQAVAGATALPPGTWRRFLPYAAMSFIMSSSDYFSSQYFSVYWLDGLEEVALFWVAYSLIKQIQAYVYTPMVGIQVPLFTRVRAEGDQRLPRVFATIMRLLLVLLVPSGVLLAVFLHNLMLVQYPAEYSSAIPAGLVLIPFLFLEPFWGVGHNILMVHENYRLVLLSRLAALSSIPLLALLVPRYGAVGAALAIGLSRSLAGLVVLLGAILRHRLALPWRFAGKILLASLAAAAVVLPPLLWLGLVPAGAEWTVLLFYGLLTVALGLVALGVLLWVMRRLRVLHDEDRALLAELRHPLARRLLRLL